MKFAIDVPLSDQPISQDFPVFGSEKRVFARVPRAEIRYKSRNSSRLVGLVGWLIVARNGSFRGSQRPADDGTHIALLIVDGSVDSKVKLEVFMKILIATDGSQFSETAMEKACDFMEGREDVTFKVISVYEPAIPMASEPFAISAEYYQRLDDAAKGQAEAAAQKSAEFISKKMAIPVAEVISVTELGNPAQVIVEAAEKWEADLVVVGSHGYGFWSRLALGSVSDAVLHHAPCSVLVVKQRA